MRFFSTGALTLGLCGALMLAAGCAGPSAGTRAYQPLPKWEATSFQKASRTVFPNDVREQPGRFGDTLVAWTGVITKVDFYKDGSSRVAYFTVDHHYFDWLETTGQHQEKLFPSPRGEGTFTATWPARTAADEAFLKQFAAGDMLVAYGYPSSIHENAVHLGPTQNLRAIKPQWYRTDVLEYGRTGKPATLLKPDFYGSTSP